MVSWGDIIGIFQVKTCPRILYDLWSHVVGLQYFCITCSQDDVLGAAWCFYLLRLQWTICLYPHYFHIHAPACSWCQPTHSTVGWRKDSACFALYALWPVLTEGMCTAKLWHLEEMSGQWRPCWWLILNLLVAMRCGRAMVKADLGKCAVGSCLGCSLLLPVIGLALRAYWRSAAALARTPKIQDALDEDSDKAAMTMAIAVNGDGNKCTFVTRDFLGDSNGSANSSDDTVQPDLSFTACGCTSRSNPTCGGAGPDAQLPATLVDRGIWARTAAVHDIARACRTHWGPQRHQTTLRWRLYMGCWMSAHCAQCGCMLDVGNRRRESHNVHSSLQLSHEGLHTFVNTENSQDQGQEQHSHSSSSAAVIGELAVVPSPLMQPLPTPIMVSPTLLDPDTGSFPANFSKATSISSLMESPDVGVGEEEQWWW
jgi:hypothetical protein